MPKISIIVPVYNVEKYIQRCIDSILAQTFTDYELILVDDGSPDRCGEICDDYAKKENRIVVIHKKNGGVSAARNAGLDVARGEYLGFIDGDDYIAHDMYEKLLQACIENNADIATCGRYNVYENKITPRFSFEGSLIWSSKEAIESLLARDNIGSSVCDKLFNRKLFEKIRFPVEQYYEDIIIMPQLLFVANKIVHIGESKYYYNRRPDSFTKETFTVKRMHLLDAYQEVLGFVVEKHPDLKPNAQGLYFNKLLFLMRIMQASEIKGQFRNEYNSVRRLILRNTWFIISNKYLGNRNKIKMLLYATNTYNLFHRIRICTKRLRIT
ncbi:MAG: glycosyltransferase [Sphaerochaetaceae bacterium]|jgi:glycosyltransferase involved in cell wall biosynthesis